jgi:hypothetical protein
MENPQDGPEVFWDDRYRAEERWGIPELTKFQDHFSDYMFVVYAGLKCDSIMSNGRATRPNALISCMTMLRDTITSSPTWPVRWLSGASVRHVTTRVDVTWYSPWIPVPCDLCNRHFRNQTCLDNHKSKRGRNKKSACELRKCCRKCGALITHKLHKCNKRFCVNLTRTKRWAIFALCVLWWTSRLTAKM